MMAEGEHVIDDDAGTEAIDYLVAAGPSFKPGEPEEQSAATADLLRFLMNNFGITAPTHVWTNEDFKSMDGAPFVGPATSSHPNLVVATGFNAWGITQGVVAAQILAARILGLNHPGAELYDSTRVKPLAGGATFPKENSAAGMHLVQDRLLKQQAVSVDSVTEGNAAVVEQGGELLAVRRFDGRLIALSAICSHMGCIVNWNPTDRTWDCPCHGSRFDEDGAVMSGPAVTRLEARTGG